MVDLELPSGGMQTVLADIAGAEAHNLPHESVMRVIPILRRDLCKQVP